LEEIETESQFEFVEFAMARPVRHKHHSRKSRSQWIVGAFVASTAFAPAFTATANAAALHRRLELLRIAVPSETQLARALPAQAPAGDQRQMQFDIPAGTLRAVLAEIERISGVSIAVTDAAITDISSPGVSGRFSPLEAIAHALHGTSVTSRVTGPNRVSLEIRLASESVDVTGAVPQPQASSPKYSQPLIDVPQTIEVIPREVMDAQGVTTLSDALRNVPGISLQAGEGGGASNTSGDMFNLRGFSANNSLFVDGVRDDGLMSRDVFNLEQIEVFMGPTGSDIGRGNAAGYVNMQTKSPHEGEAYAVTYGYGSGDLNRTTVDLNQDIALRAPDTWLGRSAVRLNALWEDGGVAGRDIVTRKNQSIAPSIALGLNTETRVSAGVQITRQDNVPDYGIPGSAWSETQLAPTTVIADQPVDSRNFYGSVGYDADQVAQESYTGRIEHDVNSSLTLRNQVRYNETHRTAVITAIQNPAAFVPETQTVILSRQGNERENSIFSNQTSLSARFATGGLRHSANAGIEIASEEQFAPSLVGLGTRDPVSIYHPNPFDPVIGYQPVRGLAYSRGKTNSVGLYLFDTVELGARWQLSGGMRWEHYDAAFEAADALGALTTDLAVADGLISGKAGVLFRVSDAANIYVSYGSSVTPPGTANFTLSTQPNNQNNPNVKPQESKNYEVGGKFGFFDSRLSLSAALFRTHNKNVIFTVDATAIPPVFNQDDAQRVNGFTIGSLGQITPRWQILTSFGYLDTRQISQNPLNDGRRLVLTPRLSGSVWTTYALPRGVTLGGGLRYMDDVFVNAPNTIRVPNYSLVDAMVEYDVNTHLSLRLNINNVTDEVYIKNVNNNGGRFNPGTPRAAIVTSSVRF
jgi:catecholate siderophore receptor